MNKDQRKEETRSDNPPRHCELYIVVSCVAVVSFGEILPGAVPKINEKCPLFQPISI